MPPPSAAQPELPACSRRQAGQGRVRARRSNAHRRERVAVGNVGRKAPGAGVRGVAAIPLDGETLGMSDADTHPEPRAIIIAGPDGAGKTTFAREFLPAEGECPTFINADLIAEGLSPFQPDQAAVEASRLMLEHVRQRVAKRQDFAIETTLAGRAYLRMIREWKAVGYQVEMIFLQLPSADLAVQRVRQRVAQGGHSIPEAAIRRRFDRGLLNLRERYRNVVNVWQVFDASQWPPVLLDEGVNP